MTMDTISEVTNICGNRYTFQERRYNSVGVAKGYGLDGRDLIPVNEKNFFLPQRPDRLWGPPSLIPNE
jgi:hypothetical protein